MDEARERQRVFLALRPPGPLRSALAAVGRRQARAGGGRPVPAENIHLTLAFLGSLRPPQVEAVRRLAGGLEARAFHLRLERLGLWRRGGILWAGGAETPPALAALVAALRDGLGRLGFQVDRRPFRVHLTLVRGARRAGRWDGPPLDWAVEDFRLYASRLDGAGARYTELDRWPLGPAADG